MILQAGLFSAVLTAFTVETYVLLQPNPTDTTNALLAQMSAQLNSFTVTPTFINSTQPSVELQIQSTFRVTPIAVWINTLWFSSLICSLSAASIGMMVKQWLHEYELGLSGSSQDVARLRQHRYEALRKWHVDIIVALLPILLQLASALFLAGLLVLLWSLHQTVAAVASTLVGILLVFTIVTVLAPAFAPDCAYRSPQALACVFFVQTIRHILRALAHLVVFLLRRRRRRPGGNRASKLLRSARATVNYSQWAGMERPVVQELQYRLDQKVLVVANAVARDDSGGFTDRVLRPCIRALPSQLGYRCLKVMYGDAVAQRRLDHNNISASSAKAVSLALEVIESHLDGFDDNDKRSREPLENLVADLRHRLQFPYIDVNVSMQLYQTLARLLSTYTKDTKSTADVLRILENLSQGKWDLVYRAHYRSIICGNAVEASE